MSGDESTMTDSVFGDKLQWSMLHTSKSNVATEDHLQSLGLEVNDGLPKFRLNEPGPAALASSIFQQNNMVIDESEQSFVVLGKTSLESIRETSLASYMEIQQKSTNTDHTSLISMMSPLEIEDNLKKVLEENIKLKETLKQNNNAIKQQFNTITMWQKEVMTVCDNHKQKFLETKELISRLKKENDELRETIAKSQLQETSLSSIKTQSLESGNIDSLLKKSNYLSTEDIQTIPSFNSTCFEESKILQNDKIQLQNEQELLKKIGTLSEELTEVKINHSKTQKVLGELEKRYATDIQLFSQELHKANKEVDAFKQKLDVSNPAEFEDLITKCCEKDLELKYLKDIITSLEQQIRKFKEDAFPLIDLEIEVSEETSQDKHILKENVEFYNAKMSELNKCFDSQCSRYLRIQEFLKESAEIIQLFENTNMLSNHTLPDDSVKTYKEKLYDIRKKLIDEQLQSIDDKQTTIKVQKQFQKMLSDYNSVIYELEILKDENSKLTTLQTKAAEENSQKLAEIEKHLNDEKNILDNEKADLLEEKLSLQLHKRLVLEEKEVLEVERNSLKFEKEKLKEEKIILSEEKTSLDRQCRLYEVEEGTHQREKKVLQKKCEDLTNAVDNLTANIQIANATINELRATNSKLKENEEMILVYKIQAEIHQKEFEEMRISQKNLQDQLQTLSMANLHLRSENDRLGGEESSQNSQESSNYCGLCAMRVLPGERHGMGKCIPEFD